MVSAAAVLVLPGRDHRFFCGSFISGGSAWRCILRGIVFHDIVSGDPNADLGRSGGGLAFDGLRDPVYGRDPTALHGNHGRVSLENLSGIQTSSDLYCKEFQL